MLSSFFYPAYPVHPVNFLSSVFASTSEQQPVTDVDHRLYLEAVGFKLASQAIDVNVPPQDRLD
jgi:hypothetical protein